jgi:hypothetical protein
VNHAMGGGVELKLGPPGKMRQPLERVAGRAAMVTRAQFAPGDRTALRRHRRCGPCGADALDQTVANYAAALLACAIELKHLEFERGTAAVENQYFHATRQNRLGVAPEPICPAEGPIIEQLFLIYQGSLVEQKGFKYVRAGLPKFEVLREYAGKLRSREHPRSRFRARKTEYRRCRGALAEFARRRWKNAIGSSPASRSFRNPGTVRNAERADTGGRAYDSTWMWRQLGITGERLRAVCRGWEGLCSN